MSGDEDESNYDVTYEPVESWVDELLAVEDQILRFLNSLETEYVADGQEARDRLRKFADTSKFREAFIALYFIIVGQEDFFDDVREVKEESVEERLREIREEFSHLETEISAVYREEYYSRWNPVHQSYGEVRTLEGGTEIPVVEERLYSGDVQVFCTKDTPSHILHACAMMINDIGNSIDEHQESIQNSDEEEEIAEELDHIERHVDELREMFKNSH